MVSPKIYRDRTEQLKKILEKENLDAILILNLDEPFKDPNFLYFAATDPTNSVYVFDNEAKIITNSLELPKIKAESFVKKIIAPKVKFSSFLKKTTTGKKIGVTELFPTLLAKKLSGKFFDITNHLEEIRAIKSKEEIVNIKKASKTATKITSNLQNFIKAGVTENEIKNFINIQILKHGCETPPFAQIVNAGKNSSVPHPLSSNKKIRAGDVVLVDFLCKYKNYFTDISRVFFVGKIDKKILSKYQLLQNVFEKICEKIEPNISAAVLDKAAREALGADAKYFTHALGHGVGLAPHEKPHISEKSKDVLKEGMVFAIEPGVYFKNFGLRIEDTFLLTKKGLQNLTKSSL